MKLFSSLFGNKKSVAPNIEVEINTPVKIKEETAEKNNPNMSEKILEIAKKLSTNTLTAKLAEEIKVLALSDILEKDKFEGKFNELSILIKKQLDKISAHKLLVYQLNNIKHIEEITFDKKFSTFDKFYKDFPLLTTEFELLEKLSLLNSHLFDDIDLKQLHAKYKAVAKAFNQATLQSKELIIEEEALSAEIIKYTNTVSELQRKYSLSIDWDGKKNMMISLGRKLSEKRETLIKREKSLEDELKVLYEGYPTMRKEFISHCEDFKQFFQGKIQSVDAVNLRQDELNLILEEFKSLLESIE